MGYAVYEHQSPSRTNQFAGYGVPAFCDYPGCDTKIDRGFGFACGEDGPRRNSCGGYFCGKHQNYDIVGRDRGGPYRIRCNHSPGDRDLTKPEHPEWIEHVSTDESWAQFRKENPKWRQEWQ